MNAALALFRRVCGSVAALLCLGLWSVDSFASFAATSTTTYSYRAHGTNCNYNTSPDTAPQNVSPTSACTALGQMGNGFTGAVSCNETGGSVGYAGTWGSCTEVVSMSKTLSGTAYSCPTGATLSGSSCTCNSGYTQSGSSCVPNAPAACGTVHDSTIIVNLTAGYMRSPGGAMYPTFKPDGSLAPSGDPGLPPTSICYEGCLGVVGSLVDSWSSSEPTATGLYRVSDDYNVTFTNAQCVGGSGAPNSTVVAQGASAPPCDGFLGYVDGKARCVAKVPDSGFVGSKGSVIGNPKAGAQGGGFAPGNIPATGNGGPSGGPATPNDGAFRSADGAVIPKTAASAPTGYKAPVSGSEQAACGAPGQPICGVKVDETGLSTKPTADGLDKIDAAKAALDLGISGAISSEGKDTSWGLIPTWLTTNASCQPVVLWTMPPKFGSQQIIFDICPQMPTIYLLMNWLWSIWTFFIIVGMVFRVTTRGAA